MLDEWYSLRNRCTEPHKSWRVYWVISLHLCYYVKIKCDYLTECVWSANIRSSVYGLDWVYSSRKLAQCSMVGTDWEGEGRGGEAMRYLLIRSYLIVSNPHRGSIGTIRAVWSHQVPVEMSIRLPVCPGRSSVQEPPFSFSFSVPYSLRCPFLPFKINVRDRS